MARPLRVAYPGAFYHVMSRGIEGRNIFKENKDCEHFLQILAKAALRYRILFHAYVLMPNHYHLAIETLHANISKAMHFINVAFTQYFNKKYQRCGYLFQGRFKAILVQKESYLLALSRYIHQNPVRARLVDKPQDYLFSSYPVFLGLKQWPIWLNTADTLSSFGNLLSNQQDNYRIFVEAEPQEDLFKNTVGRLILGNEEFTAKIKKDIKEKISLHQEYSPREELKPYQDPEKIFNVVCQIYNIDETELKGGRWKHCEGRSLGMYFLREMTQLSLKEIGEQFGISYPAVSLNIKQVDKKIKTDRGFNQKLEVIRECLERKT